MAVFRDIPNELERYQEQDVLIHIHNESTYDLYIRLKDNVPPSFQAVYPCQHRLKKRAVTKISYPIFPQVRGKYFVQNIYIRVKSILGLWEKQITFSQSEEIKVIPNLSETKRYLENAQQYLLHEGMKIRKMRSGPGEFAKVRHYAVGDDPRKINWRQSAKLQEVMTNEFEPEHGKYITILIDCGRMMGVELEDGNRLEKSVEAALTVAAAALDNGDYVSVIAFSKDIQAVVPAGKGLEHLQTILQTIYAVQVNPQESNYALAIQYAQSMQKKRSMLLLFSDVQTFIHEDYHLHYMQKLRRKHLFFVIGIQDSLLQKKLEISPSSVSEAMEKSLAQKQYLQQKETMLKWQKHGLPMLEAPAEQLAATAVSQYINTLNRGLL